MVAAAAEAGAGGVWELLSPPSDAVTNVRFSSHSDHLLVSSLDLKLRLYDAAANILRGEFLNQGPVLDCCFHDDSSGYSATASADNRVSRFDFNTGSELFLGSHEAHVCCVEYSHPTGQVFTGSRDKTVRRWDARNATHLGAYSQPDVIVSMSLVDQHLVVATGDRQIIVYDIRQMSHPIHMSETLRCQTCCVRCYPSGTGYAVSSMDGRVMMDYFDASEAKTRKYAFKCHRNPEMHEKWEQIFYPVNALAFHPVYGTLATGGADRHVNIWDGNSKKRLFQYSKSPYPISSLAFSRDGQMLAVASSYTFDPEEEPSWIESVKICVRRVNEAEVKPKRSSRH